MLWDKAKFARIEYSLEQLKKNPSYKSNPIFEDFEWVVKTLRAVGIENEELHRKLLGFEASRDRAIGDDEASC
jgi:hypothetical protein